MTKYEFDYYINVYGDLEIKNIKTGEIETFDIILIKQIFKEKQGLIKYLEEIKLIIEPLCIIENREYEGKYRPIKNTSKDECYKALKEIKIILDKIKEGNYEN